MTFEIFSYHDPSTISSIDNQLQNFDVDEEANNLFDPNEYTITAVASTLKPWLAAGLSDSVPLLKVELAGGK